MKQIDTNSEKCIAIASSDSQIDKPQRGRPKRAELPDVNIDMGKQSINTESFFNLQSHDESYPAKMFVQQKYKCK